MPTVSQTEFERGIEISVDNTPADVIGYDDIQGNVLTAPRNIASPPSTVFHDHGITSGVEFPTTSFDVGDSVYRTSQTFHRAKLQSIIDEHIHYGTAGDATGTKLAFQIDVIYANIGEAWAVVSGSPFLHEWDVTLDRRDHANIEDIADLPAINTGVSCLYKIKLTRTTPSASGYTGDVYIDFVDGHIQIDQGRGSRQETVK